MPRVTNNNDILNEKPRELPTTVLPTICDVLLAVHYAKLSSEQLKTTWIEFEKKVAKNVIGLWEKASIPTITLGPVQRKVTKINQELLLLMNTDKNRKQAQHFQDRAANFKVRLFLCHFIHPFKLNVIPFCSLSHRFYLMFALASALTLKGAIALRKIKSPIENMPF